MADDDPLDLATEGSRLLGSDLLTLGNEEQNARPQAQPHWIASRYQASSANAIVTLVSAIIFLLALSETMALIPMGRLIEDVVCRKYYGTLDPVDEKLCKVDEVQTELAWLGGLYVVVDSAIGIVFSS